MEEKITWVSIRDSKGRRWIDFARGRRRSSFIREVMRLWLCSGLLSVSGGDQSGV